MQKTKTINRVLSLVLALLMVLSLFPAMGVSAFAEEGETATTLSDGQYIVPVLPIVWKTEAASTSNLPNSFRALLSVENGTYTVTMKLNSDMLSGWVLDTKYNDTYTTPKSIWESLGSDEQEVFDQYVSEGKGSYYFGFLIQL